MANDELNEVKRKRPTAPRRTKTSPAAGPAVEARKPSVRRAKAAPSSVAPIAAPAITPEVTPKPPRKRAAPRAKVNAFTPAQAPAGVDAPPPAVHAAAFASPGGEKLGFGHYRHGTHGPTGVGWLPGAVAVAAVLLVLGLIA